MRQPYLRHGTIIGACPYWDNILDETNTNFFSDLESLSEVHQLLRKIQIMDRVFLLQDRAGCCANLVIGDSRALLFDTCCGWDDLMGAVRELTGLPLLVINSHGHYDHVGGNAQFDRVYLHPADFPLLRLHEPELLRRWRREMAPGSENDTPVVPAGVWGNTLPLDFQEFDLGGFSGELIPLPGHTEGSVGVWFPSMRLLLSGDALTPVMCLNFAGHLSPAEQEATLLRVIELKPDIYLTSHQDHAFDGSLLPLMLQCVRDTLTKKGYPYDYPVPPYGSGRLFLNSKGSEPVALICEAK
jgi:glyoxylase-like metal-dependent hydrolase (beta-lactamase superfamily II)